MPPATLIGRVCELAMAVDPDLVMGRSSVLNDVRQGDWYLVMGIAVGCVVLVGVLIALIVRENVEAEHGEGGPIV